MPAATNSVQPIAPPPRRRRPEVRVRVYVLPERSRPDPTGDAVNGVDRSQACVLDDSVFFKIFGTPISKADKLNQPLYLAIQIPSLTPPKTSEGGFVSLDDDALETGWKIVPVWISPAQRAAESPSSDSDGSIGTVGIPPGLFPALGVGTGRTRGVGVVGVALEVRPMPIDRVLVTVRHPAGERIVTDDQTGTENVAEEYTAAVKQSLSRVSIVREGDSLNVSDDNGAVSTATIGLVEPVRQGVMSADTQVVIQIERVGGKTRTASRVGSGPGMVVHGGRAGKRIGFDAIQEEPSSEDEDDDSDDDDDSIMTLAPTSSILTGLGVAGTGMATPGSMMSTFTSGQPKSAVFRPRVLTKPIRNDAIVPVPAEDESNDDGSRIFARPGGLVRVGVMAGDWVWIESGQDLTSGFGLGGSDDDPGRAVRIYGIPGPDSAVRSAASNNDIVMSPFLFGNLGCPTTVRVSRLMMNGRRVRMSASPPVAAEVRLVRIASRVGMEKRAQPAVVAGVKRFFGNRRLVSAGDLVAIRIDIGEGDDIEDAVGPMPNLDHSGRDVVWFRVAGVDGHPGSESEAERSIRSWGCAAVDPAETTVVQAGAEQRRIFGGAEWRRYLGLSVFEPGRSQGDAATTNPLLARLIPLFSVAGHPSQLVPPTRLLLTGKRSSGKAWTIYAAAAAIGMHVFEIDCWEVLASDRDVQAEAVLRARIERAVSVGTSAESGTGSGAGTSTAVLLRNIDVLGHLPLADILSPARLVVGTASPDAAAVDDQIRGIFSHELEVPVPDEKEREFIIGTVLADRGLECCRDVRLGDVARKTAALVAGDLADLVSRADVFRRRRLDAIVRRLGSLSQVDVEIAGGDVTKLSKADFDSAVEAARKNFADAIGAPKIPNVTWNDVGGLAHVRAAVAETIELPLARPELFASGLKKRSGILFYGPPGTGKTLVAKAIATEYGLNFFSVKGPELLNMYIGESEANVRRVFQRARDARPCVVFFDELDSVAPKRGNQGDSGGVMDRIVAQLLAELDGMSGSGDGGGSGGGVFVVGATNRPDLLDQALLRPGRFDKIVYLGLPDTVDKRVKVMEALTRRFVLSDDVQFDTVVRDGGLTGADLYALCADAMLGAVGRAVDRVTTRIREIDGGDGNADGNADAAPAGLTPAQFFDHHATPEDLSVVVHHEDFVKARRELVPSVSADELRHYERVRQLFEGTDGTGRDRPGTKSGPDPVRPGLASTSASMTVVDRADSVSEQRQVAPAVRDKGKGLASGPVPPTAPLPVGFGAGADDDGLYDGDGDGDADGDADGDGVPLQV